MSRKLRYPTMNAPTQGGKVEQLRSYLYQLTDQLNWLLEDSAGRGDSQEKESTEVLFARLKPMIMQSGDIAAAIFLKLKKSFIQPQQLEEESFALRGSINGLHIHTAQPDENGDIRIKTKFAAFGTGSGRQQFFLFGGDGQQPMHAMVQVAADGSLYVDHGGCTLRTEGGELVLTVEESGSCFTFLSPEAFSIEN